MKSSVNRRIYRLKNKLSLYFNEYKFTVLICFIFLIIGASFGIFTAVKYSGEIELDNLADSNLVDFLKGDRGTMGLFFPYLFSFLFYCSVIIFINFKPFLSVITFLLLIIRSYLVAFDVTVIIILYGFTGILNVVLIILPCELMLLMILTIIAAVAIKRNINQKKFGPSFNCKPYMINYSKIFVILIIVGIILMLLKCLLMPLIRVTIIVNWCKKFY